MRILIADDEFDFCDSIAKLLRGEGWETLTATTPPAVLELVRQEGENINAVLLDYNFKHPEIDGLTLLQEIRKMHPTLPVIILTGAGTIQLAVQATRLGAMDFLQKSELSAETIKKTLYKIAESVRKENVELLKQLHAYGIVGKSPALQEIARIIHMVAKTELNILITGETGTGKGAIAKAIHELSNRSKKPFVHIDLPNIPKDLFQSELFGHRKGAFTGADRDKKGLFEQAHGGTIFLDEIGDLDAEQQARLLIPVEERRIRRLGEAEWRDIDVRFIAATDKDLETAMEQGEFRQQLYYRLNQMRIHLPPLRERREDIRPIVEYYTQQYNLRKKADKYFEPAALDHLESLEWKGNIRELRQFVERCLELFPGPIIHAKDVASLLQLQGNSFRVPSSRAAFADSGNTSSENHAGPLADAIDKFKKEYFETLLTKHRGNVTKVSAELGVSRETVYKYLRKYNLNPQDYRRHSKS